MASSAKFFGSLFFQPKNFWSGEAGQNGIANRANGRFQSAEFAVISSHSAAVGCIAPEFRRTNHFALRIQRDEAMLLAAHANGFNFA